MIVVGGTDVDSESELVFQIGPDVWRSPEILHGLATGEGEGVLGARLSHLIRPAVKLRVAGRSLDGRREWRSALESIGSGSSRL